MMGKLREGNYFICNNDSSHSPLNMALGYISFSQLGIQLSSKSIHFHESFHSFETFKECIVDRRIMYCYPLGQVNVTKSSIVSLDVQMEVILRVCIYSQNFVLVTFELILWLRHTQNSITLFRFLCRQCGIHHGPPSTRLFLTTSDHNQGISLGNKKIVP